jgi:hypothetical protein
MGKFHVRDGLYFERTGSNGVRITWPNGEEMILDDFSWASVITSVSAAGETGETFQAALRFHNDAKVGT